MSKDLRDFLRQVEISDELIRVKDELSVQYEVGAAVKYLAQYEGKAVIFERIKGYDVPIVSNLLGSRRRLAIAFGVEENDLDQVYMARGQDLIKPKIVGSAPVQSVIESEVDICKTLPVLTHHERDAGPYFTSAVTIAKDPETGIRGMGVHRIQVKDKDTLGIFLRSGPLSHCLAVAERQGKPLEIAVASGVAPLVFCAAVFQAPQGIDKFEIAGGFSRAPIELVRCHSVDLEVPADAEFILEGYVIPDRREREGPFGGSLGYYVAFDNPVAKIKMITHRRNPVYHALMPFAEEEKVLGGLTRASRLDEVRNRLPQVQQLYYRGASGEVLIVQIDKKTDEDAAKVIDHFLSTPNVKLVVVTDDDIDISDPDEVAWAIATRVYFDKNVIIRSDLPASVLDPSSRSGERTTDRSPLVARASKMGIDATKPLSELERFERADAPAHVKQKIVSMMKSR